MAALVVLLVLSLGVVLWLLASAKTAVKDLQMERSALDVRLRETSGHVEHLRAEALDRDARLRDAAARIEQLRRFEQILDAEGVARELLRQAGDAAKAMETAAQEHARSVTSQADTQARATEARTNAILGQARREAEGIVAKAQRDAEQTAGEAIRALQESKRLEKTVQAMKNVIEGYGDRYLYPSANLLDDLAEEFGFTEAGQKLKEARARTRDMIAKNRAADCDYAEANRRTTAIEFVLDAFNGKVDTVLSDAKSDNFGKLRQRILDAFELVNHNGTAFRNARITQQYLDARLEELRWGTVAQELKLKEREEQRALKERIREEERAQKEYERAIREAEKEEETLRKALDKARKEVEKASADERSKFEERLRELTEKLHAAEEKNQRALSMAQQTRSGHVYVISNIGSFGEHVYKIGMTRRLEPLDRVRELGDASVPFEFDVHTLIASSDAPALENALQKAFVRSQVNKVNARKEFFRVALQDIRAETERMGLQATWTMTAECREYRETQSIERAMASKDFDEQAWIAQQSRVMATAQAERVEEAIA